MSPGQLSSQPGFASICLSAPACGPARTPLSAAGERLLNLICPLRDLSQAFDRPSQWIQGASGSQGCVCFQPPQKKHMNFNKIPLVSCSKTRSSLFLISASTPSFFYFHSASALPHFLSIFLLPSSPVSPSVSPPLSPPGRSIVSS